MIKKNWKKREKDNKIIILNVKKISIPPKGDNFLTY